MMLLGPLMFAAMIAALVVAVQRGVRHTDRTALVAPSSTVQRAALSDVLDGWVAAGLISAEQEQAILDHERPPVVAAVPGRDERAPAPPRRIPVFAEALGYLGGALALAGLTLLVANYWPDLATSARLLLSFVTTLGLVGAGALAREHADPALARMRWFLWTLSSATAALFTGVLVVDTLEVDTTLFVVAACAGTVAVENLLLWWFSDRPVQEMLFFVSAIVAAGTLVAGATNVSLAGLTVWILAAGALVVGLRDLTAAPIIPHVVGAVAMMIGAFVTAPEGQAAGWLFVVATVAVLFLLAALPQLQMSTSKRVALVVVAGIGAMQGIAPTLGYFAADAGGATGLVTWSLGAVLMAVGARRLLLAPVAAEMIGGVALLGGAALTAVQWPSFAPLFGLATALSLLVIGMLPGRVIFSLIGSLGLLVNVPWTIGRFFPGEGRAPLLILVSGGVIIAVAVLLARQAGRLRTELRSTPDPVAPGPSSQHRDRELV